MLGAIEIMVAVLTCILILVCLAAVYFVARLRLKALNTGSFNVAYRRSTQEPWVAGVCHYAEDLLKWYRIISLKWGSSVRWVRLDFDILDSEVKETDEGMRLAILHCRAREAKRGDIQAPADFYLAMGAHDYSGLVSWMESAPPQPAEVF